MGYTFADGVYGIKAMHENIEIRRHIASMLEEYLNSKNVSSRADLSKEDSLELSGMMADYLLEEGKKYGRS